MIVLCLGMRRSASTLQYNLVRGLVEAAGRGKGVGFVRPGERSELFDKFEKWSREAEIYVVKSHKLPPRVDTWSSPRVMGLYIFRDIRGVAGSVKRKSGKSGKSLLNEIESYIQEEKKIRRMPKLLVQRYENVTNNITYTCREIESFVGTGADDKDIERIANKFKIENSKEIANRLKYSPAFWFKKMLKKVGLEKKSWYPHDDKTLLHPNHITSGEQEKWKETLTHEEVEAINESFEKWLMEHGYDI